MEKKVAKSTDRNAMSNNPAASNAVKNALSKTEFAQEYSLDTLQKSEKKAKKASKANKTNN